MNKSFDQYMSKVREQLDCNATEEYKNEHIVYMYSNDEIDNNLDYFEKCYNDNLSEYKALLFFYDYKKEHNFIESVIKPICIMIYFFGIIGLFILLFVAFNYSGYWKSFVKFALFMFLYHVFITPWCFNTNNNKDNDEDLGIWEGLE